MIPLLSPWEASLWPPQHPNYQPGSEKSLRQFANWWRCASVSDREEFLRNHPVPAGKLGSAWHDRLQLLSDTPL